MSLLVLDLTSFILIADFGDSTSYNILSSDSIECSDAFCIRQDRETGMIDLYPYQPWCKNKIRINARTIISASDPDDSLVKYYHRFNDLYKQNMNAEVVSSYH